MKQRARRYFTQPEKEEVWDRWENGESLNSIARSLERGHSAVQSMLARTGSIRPAPKQRSRIALTVAEREEISRGIAAGLTIRAIAAQLGRAPSTISREIQRNGGRRCYRANKADDAAWQRAHRPKTCKLAKNPAVARIVAEKLMGLWSPRQIAGWLKRTFPDDESFQVSHETIYLTLYIQARGALKKELIKYLRRSRAMRRSRHHTQKAPDHGRIVGAVAISERPPEIEDRAVPGHWEGDLVCGSNNSQIAMLVRLKSKDTKTVVDALIKQAHKLPRELYKSLTWDRGKELAAHKRFSLATDIDVYFCYPQQPWQRGSNENTNGLLRQYFPKGMDLSNIHQYRLNAVARSLNERPRETLQFYSPAEKFNDCVASTG